MFKQLKYVPGKRIKDKVIVFAVDDYGNVRLGSSKAKTALKEAGCIMKGPYDQFDALETTDDLHALFEVLSSVKDKKGNHAIFTPYFLTHNIDFEGVRASNYNQYKIEPLYKTYERMASNDPSSYDSVLKYVQDGIKGNIFVPALHGREHVNIETFNYYMDAKDPVWKLNIDNDSYASIDKVFEQISPYAPFDFETEFPAEHAKKQIEDACQTFKDIFQKDPVQFNPPAGREPSRLHKSLRANGIKFIDMPFIKKEHKGRGKFSTSINYTGKQLSSGLKVMVRNVFFEPAYGKSDWVGRTMNEIEKAFWFHKPVIISTHRVNYCGKIDERNRAKGLSGLQELLKCIVKKYPDVLFMSSMQLMDTYYN